MERWIWLSSIPHVGPVTQKKLLAVFGSPERVYHASPAELQEVKGISKRAREAILAARSLERPKRILELVYQKEIWLLPRDDPLYPYYANDVPESPVLLYYKGLIQPILPSVAIVGSRTCSNHARRATEELSHTLSRIGIPVISGLAKGIDQHAHVACLANRGRPIAFVAHGVDDCYPKEHRSLFEAIIDQGAVISQYPPGTAPKPKQFIQRNALISAWSSHVVIMEADVKSGAMTTAHFAQKQARQVFAFQNKDDRIRQGTNCLIEQGVLPYVSVSSFISRLELTPITREK
ncbi:DNA-processing protein DprA [Pseudalkalibacillus hwajinpoensis]|uniref:DNA-protecting protein DprA n=1 Tax=Guptibacillus hwajinpoensis TaxID=208199 RepID=A0A4U1MIX2_9BACL|nr:DNA-processing protein DprA [Pseudalkalibacillus hwajinpoensis]TKD70671.1 DNA-protecting protein DprA [Pseudalkalibacillus hwajinpoensis]